MPDAQPTATGTLQATPLAHLLVYALDRELDGTLVFEAADGGRSALLLEGGSPSKVKTAEPVIYFGRLLLEMGVIDEQTHNRTLAEVAKQQQLHGQILLREEIIDGDILRAALREQIARQVLWMFTLPATTVYGYYAGVNFLERWGGPESTRVQPLGLLWRGLRSYAEPGLVESALARLGNQELRLHPAGQITHFHLEGREQAVIDLLRAKPQSLPHLLAGGLAEEVTVRRLVYALAITRHLDLGVPGAVPMGAQEPPSSSRIAILDGTAHARRKKRLTTGARRPSSGPRAAAPPELEGSRVHGAPSEPNARAVAEVPPEVQRFIAEIRARSENVANQDYYAILGVPRDAPKSAIQTAFFSLAKRWHPDRLGPAYAAVRDAATRVFARMSEAHHVLSDDRLRLEYMNVLIGGGASAAEQDQIQAVIRGATAFQKAEVLLKRNNLVAAEEQAQLAIESDPSQADYIALYTWIQAQKPEREGQTLDDLIAKLDESVRQEPSNSRVRWYRGQLLKRAGKYDLAVRDFRHITDQDANHLDAVREIRLYEMRRGSIRSSPPRAKSSRPPGTSGNYPSTRPRISVAPPKKAGKDLSTLFGKWFKR